MPIYFHKQYCPPTHGFGSHCAESVHALAIAVSVTVLVLAFLHQLLCERLKEGEGQKIVNH